MTPHRSPAPRVRARATLILLLLGSLSCAGAAAESETEMLLYDGRWTARVDTEPAATVTLREWEGTWRWTAKASREAKSACRGKALPITVQHSGASGLEFTAWGSTVSPACPDIAVSLKPVDDRSLDGTTDAGSTIRLTRASRR